MLACADDVQAHCQWRPRAHCPRISPAGSHSARVLARKSFPVRIPTHVFDAAMIRWAIVSGVAVMMSIGVSHRARSQARASPRRGGGHPRRRRGRRQEGERLRTLPPATVRALADSGLFALKVPESLGGAEADPVTQLAVLEALTQIDASAGWCLMVATTAVGLPAGFLPDEAIEKILAGGRVPPAAVAILPTGTATPVDGGYRLTGRWPFASGVRHAEWLTAGAMVRRDAAGPGRAAHRGHPGRGRGDPRQLDGRRSRGHGQQRLLRHRLLRARRVHLEPRHRHAAPGGRALPARHARLRRPTSTWPSRWA